MQTITLFTIPQAFENQYDLIQYQAIKSWTLLNPKPDIFLLGNAPGVASIANELGLYHLPNIEQNASISEIAKWLDRVINNTILVYINPNVILTDGFSQTIQDIYNNQEHFLLTGQYRTIQTESVIDFNDTQWQHQLRVMADKQAMPQRQLQDIYLVFTKQLLKQLFVLNPNVEYTWEQQLFYAALRKYYPIIDGSPIITPFLQTVNKFVEPFNLNFNLNFEQLTKEIVQEPIATQEPIVIATSIAPGNIETQQAAMQSWQQHGFSVVSFNSLEETRQLQPIYPDITFHVVDRDASAEEGKAFVYVDDIFAYLQEQGTQICGIVNSDIYLRADNAFLSFIHKQAENAILFASRLDVNSIREATGKPLRVGFDIFFLDKRLLKNFPASKFCLGLPAWDYWLPAMALKKGLPLKYLDAPIFRHVKHAQQWSLESQLKYTIHLTEFFDLPNQPIKPTNQPESILRFTREICSQMRDIFYGDKTTFITYNKQEVEIPYDLKTKKIPSVPKNLPIAKDSHVPLVATTAPIVMVTSIAPGNVENQKAAMQSWQAYGFSIVSLNNQEEVKQLQPIYTDITFYMVNRDARAEVGKPLIYLDSVFDYLREYGTNICGIVNSDIHLKADSRFVAFIHKEVKNALLFASRMDIESLEKRAGAIYWDGLDVFFFERKLLKRLPSSQFCLGIPWWDHWLPLIMQSQGISLKYMTMPFFHHVKHANNWQYDNYIKYGIHFSEFFELNDLSKQLKQMYQENSPQLKSLISNLNQQSSLMIYLRGNTTFVAYS